MTADAPQAVVDYAAGIELETNNSGVRNAGSLPRNIRVRVAYAGPSRQYNCRLLTINTTNQGEDLMIKLHELSESGSGRVVRFISTCKNGFLMRQHSVWVVSISLVSRSKSRLIYLSTLTCLYQQLSSSAAVYLEEQPVNPAVYIKHSERSESLTHAFHHPAQLQSANNFVLDHLEGIIDDHLAWSVPKQALCLRRDFSWKAAFIWSCMALVLSTGIGVGAGLAKQYLGLGFAIGTGMLAVFAAIQCVLFWRVSVASF